MKPAGYLALVDQFRLEVLRPWRSCFVRKRGSDRITRQEGGRVVDLYPVRYDPGEAWTDHLTFALKHEGVNLEILAALFRSAPESELTAWIKDAPTGRYTRLAWSSTNGRRSADFRYPTCARATTFRLWTWTNAMRCLRRRPDGHGVSACSTTCRARGSTVRSCAARRALKSFEAEKLDEEAGRALRRFPAGAWCTGRCAICTSRRPSRPTPSNI